MRNPDIEPNSLSLRGIIKKVQENAKTKILEAEHISRKNTSLLYEMSILILGPSLCSLSMHNQLKVFYSCLLICCVLWWKALILNIFCSEHFHINEWMFSYYSLKQWFLLR